MRLCLLLLLCLPPRAEPERHVDALRGFSIEVPDGWRAAETDQGEAGHSLLLTPPDSIGREGVTITVLPLPEPGAGPDALVAAARVKAAARGESEARDVEDVERELAGRRAPGLAMTYRAPAGDFRLEIRFLVEDGRGYGVQAHAPEAAFEERAAEFERVIETFAFERTTDEARVEGRLAELAARAGDEAGWAESWEDAARVARAEDKLVLVALWLLPGFRITDTPRNTTFADDDVLELVAHRFVPLWFERGMRAPFVDAYGLGPHAFGQALLVVTPAGEVVAETHAASDVDVVLPFLRGVLAARPRAGAQPEDGTPLERAARHVARGEHQEARALLADDRSKEAHRLRATLLARELDREGALAALALARAAGADEDRALWVEEGRLHLGLGDLDAARERLERAARGAADLAGQDLDAAREAELLLGYLDLSAGRARAEERWRALALGPREDRWSHRAAAALQSTALSLGFAAPVAPDPDVLAELLTPPAPAPLPPDRAAEAADGALRWLRERQRADGGWDVPAALRGASAAGSEPFVDATAALAGRALCARGATDAAERALAFVLASVERRRAAPEDAFFMDYTPWSDALMLAFLADARVAGLGAPARLARAAAALIADLGARRRDGGGWSYYVGGDLDQPGAPPHSISFVTAAAVSALARARAAGFDVPGDALDPPVAVLERMREQDGTFAYFLFHASGALEGGTGPEGAVGRGPVCELALLDAGRGSEERVEAALERFLAHRALYAAEQGKVVMHAGPQGQGCHYLLFDVAHAALAWARAGAGAKARAQVLELALACRQADGAFLDTPILGRAYGTAIALLALDALER